MHPVNNLLRGSCGQVIAGVRQTRLTARVVRHLRIRDALLWPHVREVSLFRVINLALITNTVLSVYPVAKSTHHLEQVYVQT